MTNYGYPMKDNPERKFAATPLYYFSYVLDAWFCSHPPTINSIPLPKITPSLISRRSTQKLRVESCRNAGSRIFFKSQQLGRINLSPKQKSYIFPITNNTVVLIRRVSTYGERFWHVTPLTSIRGIHYWEIAFTANVLLMFSLRVGLR